MLKPNEIRELTLEELDKKNRELRLELVNLRVRKQSGQVENPSELRTLRSDIARLETIKKQKLRSEALAEAEAATA